MSSKVKEVQSKLIRILSELHRLKDFSSQLIQKFNFSSIVEEVGQQIRQRMEQKAQRA